MSALAVAALLFFLCIAFALPLNSPLSPNGIYDYIIIGGGPAGLTVANRLSEDPSVKVLLLEAGPADQGEASVEVPGLIGVDIGSKYDWNLSTVAQVYLDGEPRNLPQGHGLGGGTLINGMLWNRGGQGDYANWLQLGNSGWGWDDILPYFMRSETYTPVTSEAIAVQFQIEADPSVHGTDGPVNVSFPNYFWNSSALLFSALNELGVPTAYDPNTGEIAGASYLPLDLDPVNLTRSTARRAYYDPAADRPNLWVSTGQFATQILFDNTPVNVNATASTAEDALIGEGSSPGMPGGIYGGTTTLNVTAPGNDPAPVKRGLLQTLCARINQRLWRRPIATTASLTGNLNGNLIAVGVEFAPDAQSPRQKVTASREVIVAAGALHSPQLLMLSGIGPAAALQDLQIPVNVNLPGVGSNLQDHGQAWCWYPFYNDSYSNPTELENNQSFTANAWADFLTNRTGPLTSSAIDGVAFPALPFIVNGSTSIAEAASSQPAQQYLAAGVDNTVIAGYEAQLPMLVEALQDATRASYELINANDGVLAVAMMRPLSRGTVTLSSSQPFDPPLIDPRYGSNPIDFQVLQAAIRFNQRLLTTQSLSHMDPTQLYPPVNATDTELTQYVQSKLQTEYHPVGTNAMMPIDLGGVVNPDLLVYGTSNLRVVDSSIIPMIPAAHLQAVVYGIAEKAADIIKAANSNSSTSSEPSPSRSNTSTMPMENVSPPTSCIPSSPTALATRVDAPAITTTFVTVIYTQTVYG